MAKIYKSNDIFMNKNQPVILNIPKISKGLSDLVAGERGSLLTDSEVFETLRTNREATVRIQKENADQIDYLYKQARTDGYTQGLEDAKIANESYRINAMNGFKEEVKKQEEEFERKIVALEAQFLEIGLLIAKKVINYEINRNDEVMPAMVQDALNQIRIKNGIVVKASIGVCEAIKTMDGLHVDNIKIIPQEGWMNDSCHIDSLLGTLDLSCEKKMERITQMLYGELV